MNDRKEFDEIIQEFLSGFGSNIGRVFEMPSFYPDNTIDIQFRDKKDQSLRDSILRKQDHDNRSDPIGNKVINNGFISSGSFSRSSVVRILPDGSTEKKETTRNSDGTIEEVVTVCDVKNICQTFKTLISPNGRRDTHRIE